MNIFKSTLILITGGVTIILFALSCKKDKAISNNDLPYYPRIGSFRSLTMPEVKNEMLQFTDHAHFDDYLAYLDAIVMDEPQTEEESDTI